MFDPEAFEQNLDSADEMSTEVPLLPEEPDYPAQVISHKFRETDSGAVILNVTWKLDYPDDDIAHEALVNQGIWLDLTADGKGLATGTGKNRQLAVLREALGQNSPGWTPGMLDGQVAIITVKNDVMDDGRVFYKVKSVRPMG